MQNLKNEYFEWMYELVYNHDYMRNHSYRKLLRYLHSIDFTYIIPMDENRAIDGIDLRYRFGYERHWSRELIGRHLDDRPCSVLEMMVALAFTCEEHIMDDPGIGNRTGVWFWGMIDNLNLSSMIDYNFDRAYVDEIISRLLNREYEPNGKGGLFTVKHSERDMRTVDIWYQLMWFLNENFDFSI